MFRTTIRRSSRVPDMIKNPRPRPLVSALLLLFLLTATVVANVKSSQQQQQQQQPRHSFFFVDEDGDRDHAVVRTKHQQEETTVRICTSIAFRIDN